MQVITLENVGFCYGKDITLENVSFGVDERDFLAIIGPNGGGKSTLAKLILGLLSPKCGSIKKRVQNIGYVPQNTSFNIDFPITALEVVLMGLMSAKISKSEKIKQARNLLSTLGIEALQNRKIRDLSGGERQKILIARALCTKPDVLLLDEPTASVDSSAQDEIFKILKNYNERGAVIIISHDISAILEHANKVLYVSKSAHMHDAPNLQISSSAGHLCEIDLLNELAKRVN